MGSSGLLGVSGASQAGCVGQLCREGFSWGRNDLGGHGGSIHTVGMEGGHTWVVRG